jgi:uncharacterized GH25 family protein
MKKSIYVLLVSMFVLTSFHAKTQNLYTFPVVAGDSLVTADTVFKRIGLSRNYSSMGIQVNIKKGTGTLDGKLYVYTSVNELSYVLTDSASITAVPVNAYTANGTYTHTAIITKAAPPGTKYVVAVTQSGSLTSSPVLFSYTTRKYN